MIFVTLFEALDTCFKVTRVIALAPHEVLSGAFLSKTFQPYHSSERRYLPSWRYYRNEMGISRLVLCWLTLVVSHLRTPILNCFSYLLWAYVLTDAEFSCLAMLAKPYPVSDPTYLPQIPNELHRMSKCANEVPGTMLVARLMSVFCIKSFALSISD